KRLASTADDGMVRLWDAESGKEALAFKGSRGVSWSPDGKRLAAVGPGKTVCVWEAESGKEVQVLRQEAIVPAVCWSPDGKQLASTGLDGKVRLWDAETGRGRCCRRRGPALASPGAPTASAWPASVFPACS